MYKTILLYAMVLSCTLSFSCPESTKDSCTNKSNQETVIQRVRIDFITPTGYIRHLLLGFTGENAATDGFDYGYDAVNADDFPDDLNWIIEGERCVIQGVGVFDESNQYPLGMFLTNSGDIEISLNSLENFEAEIEVYLFDAHFDTYTLLNEVNYSKSMISGEYTDRFFLTFSNPSLSISDNAFDNTTINFNKNSHQLAIKTNSSNMLSKLELYDSSGRKIQIFQNLHTSSFRFKINNPNLYFILKLYSDNRILTKKIAILH